MDARTTCFAATSAHAHRQRALASAAPWGRRRDTRAIATGLARIVCLVCQGRIAWGQRATRSVVLLVRQTKIVRVGIVAQSIRVTPWTTINIPGCASGFEAPGTKICEEGTTICRSEPGVNFCTICGSLPGGASCGKCYGEVCTVNTDCNPGAKCILDTFWGFKTCVADNVNCLQYSCWLPSQKGDCDTP